MLTGFHVPRLLIAGRHNTKLFAERRNANNIKQLLSERLIELICGFLKIQNIQ